ncbi:co-chaperone DjlA [Pseudidiomarina aestuarii]|uniref:Co-chaperone protein DjlA n=1 Tax=Pseudidiomarina aestuarii TaxID=624146 RepID=A0A7Z6ZRR5_9GAMM|nr:co-chaperone DjlA [Pseudidiomarina aestuarii]RUO38055.1 co-chaperone DjlA [Pseudidiomarina aestuarii]
MIVGKVLGTLFGAMVGKLFGAIIGFMIGHWFDTSLRSAMRSGPSAQGAQHYTTTLFGVLGHLAKSKGRVTEQDIDYVSTLMTRLRLQGDAQKRAQAAFSEGKASDYPLEDKVRALRRQFAWRRDLLQFFMEQVLIIAMHDGTVEPAEYEVLRRVTATLGFSQQQLDAWLSMAQAGQRFTGSGQAGRSAPSPEDQLRNAYAVLGVSDTASAAEVKKAYRKLMAKHHPDKLAAQGLPPEMRESAQAKAQEIQAAYELIKKELER